MSKSRVFVVQNQHRSDPETGNMVPKFNLAPAAQYGELVYLLSPTAAPWRPDPLVEELSAKLADFTSADFLLLIGNPVLIGFATAIAAKANDGDINCLQWSGREQKYIVVRGRGLFTSLG